MLLQTKALLFLLREEEAEAVPEEGAKAEEMACVTTKTVGAPKATDSGGGASAGGADGACVPEEGAKAAAEASAVTDSGGGADGACVPAWIFGWERRAFSFSSALDPLVAIAAEPSP